MIYALTTNQIDLIITLVGKLIDHIPSILSTIGIGFLIIRQWLNKRDTDKRLEENTTVTKEVKSQLNVITDLDQIRSMIALSKKMGSSEPVFYNVALPPETYVPFELSQGARVEWRSELCQMGKQVRFLIHGTCSMGYHFHKYTETVSGVRGKLYYETSEESVEITPGVVYSTPADTVHSARFEAPGEVVVHWPDQTEDVLEIGIWP